MRVRAESLSFRLTVGALLWLVVFAVVGGITLSELFSKSVRDAFDAQLSVHMDGLLASTVLNAGGQIEVRGSLADKRFTEPYSGWYWQIESSNGRILMRSRSLWDRNLTYRRAVFVPQGQIEVAGQSLRYVSRDVSLAGFDEGLRFLLTGDVAQLNADIRRFNTILFASMFFLGLGLIIAIVVQVRYGLRPLRHIEKSLSMIRMGKENNLRGFFPQEVKPLADEINALLEHNKDVVERSRHHVGNLAHALRTPLSVIMTEAQNMLKKKELSDDTRILAKDITHHGQVMVRYIDHHLARARLVARRKTLGEGAKVMEVTQGLQLAMSKIYADKTIEMDIRPQSLRTQAGSHDLEEMLGNVIENACKWSKSRVRIEGRLLHDEKNPFVLLTIEDDGSGLAKSKRDKVFARGARLDEMTPGSGLGLSIVREIISLYGGDILLEDSELGGLAVVLRLPALTK